MIRTFPAILGANTSGIEQRINFLQNLGHSEKDIIKITKIIPSFLGLNIEIIK